MQAILKTLGKAKRTEESKDLLFTIQTSTDISWFYGYCGLNFFKEK